MHIKWIVAICVVLALIVIGWCWWRTRQQDKCDDKNQDACNDHNKQFECHYCKKTPCCCESLSKVSSFKSKGEEREGEERKRRTKGVEKKTAGQKEKKGEDNDNNLAPLEEYKGKAKAVKTRSGHYIVVLKQQSITKSGKAKEGENSPDDVKVCAHSVNVSARVNDDQVNAIYHYGFSGYKLTATPEQIREIRKHPDVESVEIDVVMNHCGGDEKYNNNNNNNTNAVHRIPYRQMNRIPQPTGPRIMVESDSAKYDTIPATTAGAAGAAAAAMPSQNTDKASTIVPWGTSQIGACLNPLNLCNGQGNVPSVHVYVLDTGIALNNSKLNVVENRSFVTGDTSGSGGQDQNGHGTFVSSIIGAKDNSVNYVGVAPGVKLHAFKVLNASGSGALSDIITAVEAVITAKLASPSTPMIINLSLGAYVGTTKYNALDNALLAAIRQNIHVVIAAGNSSTDARFFTPAHVTQAITVGAYNRSRRFASFSNWGSVVDWLAPGVDVTGYALGGNLIQGQGTSFSAPHVTGGLALLLQRKPMLTVGQANSALSDAAKDRANSTIQYAPRTTTNKSIYIARV